MLKIKTIEPVKAIGSIVDSIYVSNQEKFDAEQKLQEVKNNLLALQAEITKQEAQNPNIFVSGWRPAIGWVCALSLSFPFFINPIIQWMTGNVGPKLPTENTLDLILALLGMASIRSYDKKNGLTK